MAKVVQTGGEALEAVLSDRSKEQLQGDIGGVPLGGIGAGKIEFCADGSIQNVTINNNIDVPISMNRDEIHGSFFAVCVKKGEQTVAKVLKKRSRYGFPTIEKINYKGIYPITLADFVDDEIGCDISLEAFSPIIPYDYKNSSLPVAVFLFNLESSSKEEMSLTVAFSWENLIGCGGWPYHNPPHDAKTPDELVRLSHCPFDGYAIQNRTGTYQKIRSKSKKCGIIFDSVSINSIFPLCYGNYTILTEGSNGDKTSYLAGWHVLGDGKYFWKDFSESGQLSNVETGDHGKEGIDHLAGSVAVTVRLTPGEKRTIPFVLAWNMPHMEPWGENYPGGVFYTNWFKNSWEAASYALDNWPDLLQKTKSLHNLLKKSNLPEWFCEKLLNDMFPLSTCTYYLKDGRFSVNEAPTRMGGCLGTIDQRLCSQVIYTLFFPRLDKVEMELFADLQGTKESEDEDLGADEGYVPHDLGWGWFRSTGEIRKWPDLASSFVLQVYRYFLWTGDSDFFDRMYSHVKDAIRWEARFNNGDIPNLGKVIRTSRGEQKSGTTYDCYHWHGMNSFTGSLWMAALKAGREMANLKGDNEFVSQCQQWYETVYKGMSDSLWNGEYFRNYVDPEDQSRLSDDCCIAQIAGEWYAQLMDWGYLLPEEKVKKSVENIIKRNDKLSKHGVADIVSRDMKMKEVVGDGVNFGNIPLGFIQYAEVYYACLAIYSGYADAGFDFIKKINDTVYKIHRRPWDVNLTIDPKTGKLVGLPWYMTNPASWFVMNAIEGFSVDLVRGRLRLSPNLPSGLSELRAPLFAPTFWAWFEFSRGPGEISFKITQIKGEVKFKIFMTKLPSKNIRYILWNGSKFKNYRIERDTLILETDFSIKKGSSLTIILVVE